MTENDNPFANMLSDGLNVKMPKVKPLVERTTTVIVAELDEVHDAYVKRYGELRTELKDAQRKEKEHLGKSLREMSNALQQRGD